ncbi:MAG: UDP-N-acetylmuramoyl-L-alanyl-D-glutamate--2,6-diaminopimelate ligase [Saprospiraceae bacterium]|nr:UDP-N-acetylmuramoyl-L-alanyl-D-glutamate--2,6-diaminopimelate ligase [Saprospiraceae bacterium]
MKTLSDILVDIPHELIQGSLEGLVEHVALDSRKSQPNGLFVAAPGLTTDGHQFIDSAISRGAKAVVLQELPDQLTEDTSYVKVADVSKYAGVMAANFYDHPSSDMQVIGVTGTNGKTSIVYLAHQLFASFGFKVGLISTVEIRVGAKTLDATLTTPDAITVQDLLAQMKGAGCDYVFMEVSSHAIDQHRIAGIQFGGGVFSNISHDHLDYHKTFKNYIQTKKRFFDDLPDTAFALTNLDDGNGAVMLQNTSAKKSSYALQKSATYKGKIIANEPTGLHIVIEGKEVFTTLVGDFNASNLLAVYGIAHQLQFEQIEILQNLSKVMAPPGRLESIWNERRKVLAFVDYAHTPDALKKVLQTIKGIKGPGSKIITVVGCGGNRDKTKRPKMARISLEYSNRVIFTSDNPRDEDPASILSDMTAALDPGEYGQVLSIENRKEAIRTANMLAREHDIILVAGKGHEKYQEIKGERLPFDDREEILKCFQMN